MRLVQSILNTLNQDTKATMKIVQIIVLHKERQRQVIKSREKAEEEEVGRLSEERCRKEEEARKKKGKKEMESLLEDLSPPKNPLPPPQQTLPSLIPRDDLEREKIELNQRIKELQTSLTNAYDITQY